MGGCHLADGAAARLGVRCHTEVQHRNSVPARATRSLLLNCSYSLEYASVRNFQGPNVKIKSTLVKREIQSKGKDLFFS